MERLANSIILITRFFRLLPIFKSVLELLMILMIKSLAILVILITFPMLNLQTIS